MRGRVDAAERGDGTLTRHGLEEYVSDCVILLDHRVTDQLSARRLRIVRYRGSVEARTSFRFSLMKAGFLSCRSLPLG